MDDQDKTEPGIVIDYRDIYDRLKDKPASRFTREMELFSRLYDWKLNDPREGNWL